MGVRRDRGHGLLEPQPGAVVLVVARHVRRRVGDPPEPRLIGRRHLGILRLRLLRRRHLEPLLNGSGAALGRARSAGQQTIPMNTTTFARVASAPATAFSLPTLSPSKM